MIESNKNIKNGFLKFSGEVAVIVLATPASVGILAKIDDRLVGLGPLIKRIIFEYKIISEKIWIYISKIIWNIDINHEIASLMLFLSCSLLGNFVFGVVIEGGFRNFVNKYDYMEKHENSEFYWMVTSQISILIISILFWNYSLFNVMFGVLVFSSIIYSVILIWMSILKVYRGKVFKMYIEYIFGVYLLSSSLIITIILLWIANLYSKFSWAEIIFSPFLYLYFLFILFYSTFLSYRGPAYILLMALGLVIFDWLGNTFIPATNAWLDEIGA